MQRFIFLITMLFFLTGSLLFYQWKAYSSQNENPVITGEETIQIKHRNGQFQIKQTIHHLPNQNFKLNIPGKIEKIKCEDGEEFGCSIENNQVEVRNGEMTFTYSIPDSKQEVKSFLLQDWLIQLVDVNIQSHHIQLSEFSWRAGNWISNTKEIAKEKVDLLDYYYFDVKDDKVILYWQQEPLELVDLHEKLIMYSSYDPKKLAEVKFEPMSQKNLFIIISNQYKEGKNDHFMMIHPQDNMKDIQRQLIRTDIENRFSFLPEEKWLSNVLSSLIVDDPPKDAKANKMFLELKNNLSEKQLKDWNHSIRSFEQNTLESKNLDQILSDISGGKIRFFTHNAKKDSPFVSFLRYDPRKVFINGTENNQINILQQNEKWLMDFLPLLEALHYHVQMKDHDIIEVEKGEVHYRFYPNKRYFDLNDKRYGTTEPPVLFTQQAMLIDIPFISILLNVEVKNAPDGFYIKKSARPRS
ncbi:hypothetical protein MUB24_01135 [Lederbergia sp. NSJ-179]|uniref:hypothetical protein n=1 Tax=Lederbergia sp. NSJ-179 TaxID=2931402 RepID=UPI001FD35639|nr:hypothetical protein [Lederbergia sp. NSJ-179]MCJ7839532.1 hypothetical protein [Lederbergia sp. NSJ-179]